MGGGRPRWCPPVLQGAVDWAVVDDCAVELRVGWWVLLWMPVLCSSALTAGRRLWLRR